jgi:type IV secretion system protein VirB9
MDTRRFLIPAACGLLSGCAVFPPSLADRPSATPPPALATDAAPTLATAGAPEAAEPPADRAASATPVVAAAPAETGRTARPYLAAPTEAAPDTPASGRSAIAAANRAARTPSRGDGFVGGMQVFDWAPGRVFEVWTAPLRVTTLTLAPGETLVSRAAGDTVRWRIGETVSGAGTDRRTHVLLKPLERGLETNLILATDRRVYLIDLRSGAPESFNAAVAWRAEPPPSVAAATAQVQDIDLSVAMPRGPLDARYRIEPEGRRPRWTPTAVFNDGLRTFITFAPDLQVDEAPALFVISADGERQLVNYRQAGGLFVVDRLFDHAELRLGGRRPQVVSLRRLPGAST